MGPLSPQRRSRRSHWRRSVALKGFRVLVALLRSSSDEGDQEARVVVAMAVADAWAQFTRTPEDPESAAILREYDSDELATRCAAVGTGHLTWHVDSIIAAWPEHEVVVAFALQALRHPRHLSSGIPTRHPQRSCAHTATASTRPPTS